MKKHKTIGLLLILSMTISACDSNDAMEDDGGNNDDELTENPVGGELWSAHFSGGLAESMEDVIRTGDGSYLVTGTIENYNTDEVDVWVVKLNADGTVEWEKAYGGSGIDSGYKSLETADGGFIVAGATESFSNGSSDIWLLKLDSEGVIEWEKSYGGSGTEQAWSVDITRDGGYVLAGGTTSFGAGKSDCLVLRLDQNGDIIWQKTFGGTEDEAGGGEYGEYVARVFEDDQGNFVVGAVTFSFGYGDSDIWLFKLDANGNIVWEFAYGDEDEDGLWMFSEREGGGYIVPGYFTPTTDYDADLWVMNIASDGSIDWQNTYGVSGVYDEALSLGATADGGALMGGSYYEDNDSNWNLTLTRVDTNGNLEWAKEYDHGFDWANSIVELPDGKFVVTGVTMASLSAQEDLLILKTSSQGTIGNGCSKLRDLTVSEEATTVNPMATNATVTIPSIIPQNTDASITETNSSTEFLCSES